MKKEVSNLIRIDSEYDSAKAEGLMLWRYGQVLEKGYAFPKHDFDLYCALLIKKNGLENLPENFKISILKDGKLDDEINFHLLRLKILDKVEISEEEFFFLILQDALKQMREKLLSKKRLVEQL